VIDALVSGKLYAKAQQRTTKTGKPFATATVRAPVRGSGNEGEAPPVVFVSVICFEAAAVSVLLALDAGDAVAVAGELSPKVYVPKDGGEPRASLDMVAQRVMSAYNVQRKRQAATRSRDGGEHQGEGEQRPPWPGSERRSSAPGAARGEFNDRLPF
jgi:single-stranded DNA-binding protein